MWSQCTKNQHYKYSHYETPRYNSTFIPEIEMLTLESKKQHVCRNRSWTKQPRHFQQSKRPRKICADRLLRIINVVNWLNEELVYIIFQSLFYFTQITRHEEKSRKTSAHKTKPTHLNTEPNQARLESTDNHEIRKCKSWIERAQTKRRRTREIRRAAATYCATTLNCGLESWSSMPRYTDGNAFSKGEHVPESRSVAFRPGLRISGTSSIPG